MIDQRIEKFNKMMDDQKFNQPIPGVPNQQQNTQSIEEQRILSQVQAGAPPAPISASQGECHQCGLIHPPIQPGDKCPNAPLKVKGDQEQQINVNELVVKIKDILASQLEQKDIKDLKKFTGEMIMNLMKFCEDYKG
jgi:hypothetical protein